MGQILEINQALVNLLDYEKLKTSSEKIMIACAINDNFSAIPIATLYDNSNHSQKFTLNGISCLKTNSKQNNFNKNFIIATPEQNLLCVLGWLRNNICNKNHYHQKTIPQSFFFKFNIYRYFDFIFLNEIVQNFLLPREYLGLSELLLNMIEHDVFKDYETAKPVKFRAGNWLNNIENHITIKPIEVCLQFTGDKVIFDISHQYEGFHQKTLLNSENTITGRGINLCKYLYFDNINFFDHSRQIIATTYRI